MTTDNTVPRALILGGTRGLGRAYAIRLLASGVQPIVVGRSADKAREDSALEGAEFVTADLTDLSTHAAVLDAAFAEGKIAPSQVLWCAGTYHRGPLAEMSNEAMEAMTKIHWLGPTAFLSAFHRRRISVDAAAKQPYDLIVIGSVLAHVPGRLHSFLCGLKSAKVHFTRTFSSELTRDLPGSMVLIVNPWGMKTEFFVGTNTKTDGFMDPANVAQLISEQVAEFSRSASLAGKGVWPVEYTLDREKDGSTKILLGPQPPKC